MKKVRFVFYRAKFNLINVIRGKRKPHLIDDGISLWTGLFNWWTPGYSHVEVWIQDMYSEVHNAFDVRHFVGNNSGICYTSTMRGKDNGTVSRPASEVFKHPERWEYIEFDVTDESFEKAKKWADWRVNLHMSYALGDLLRFVMPLWMLKGLKLDDPDREICSEHGEGWAWRLMQAMPLVDGKMYTYPLLDKILIRSPRRLWRDLVKRHHVPTYSLATGLIIRDKKGKKARRGRDSTFLRRE